MAAALILKGFSPGAALVFLITGPGDFRYGHLPDIYAGGFARDGLQAKLIDDPWMAHETCGPAALCQALDLIEQGRTP